VLSSIQNVYQTTNAPAVTSTASPGGTVTAYQTSQLANYSLALGLLSGS
jgi:hypothetical protein